VECVTKPFRGLRCDGRIRLREASGGVPTLFQASYLHYLLKSSVEFIAEKS